MKNIVVYTAIAGGYDSLKLPELEMNDIDFVCFTDNPKLKSDFWEIRNFPDLDIDIDKIRKCRNVKIRPHLYFSDYEYSIWVDGNILIKNDLNSLIEDLKMKPYNLYTFKHPMRNCIYKEAEECIKIGKDSKRSITSQTEYYKNVENYPLSNGLVESNVIVRKHNDLKTSQVMEAWWNEVLTRSRRDQLSFNYIVWKYNYSYGFLESSSRFGNTYFELHGHKMGMKDLKFFLYNKFRKIIK